MEPIFFTHFELPALGTFLALSDGQALTGLYTVDQKYVPQKNGSWQHAPELPLFATLATQLQEFCSGNRKQFDIPYHFTYGTPFQQKVWHALTKIPCGQTTSYSALAKSLDMPKGARAVGVAIGRNPLLVIVPCHRVVGKNGTLTGFAAGLELKASLLNLESQSAGSFA
jgi:methylated-DNA-[protein]-cysteine S-methyltransferase